MDTNGDGLIDDATITYTLREDNTQAGGTTEPYFIPLNATMDPGLVPTIHLNETP